MPCCAYLPFPCVDMHEVAVVFIESIISLPLDREEFQYWISTTWWDISAMLINEVFLNVVLRKHHNDTYYMENLTNTHQRQDLSPLIILYVYKWNHYLGISSFTYKMISYINLRFHNYHFKIDIINIKSNKTIWWHTLYCEPY